MSDVHDPKPIVDFNFEAPTADIVRQAFFVWLERETGCNFLDVYDRMSDESIGVLAQEFLKYVSTVLPRKNDRDFLFREWVCRTQEVSFEETLFWIDWPDKSNPEDLEEMKEKFTEGRYQG